MSMVPEGRGIGRPLYVSIVPDSTIDHIQRSPGAWPGGEAGDVILISFRLGSQSFQALNGGAPVEYGTAVSISVQCADQAEIDRLWAALTATRSGDHVRLAARSVGVPWQIVRRSTTPSGRPRSCRFCARLRRNAGHGEADAAELERAAECDASAWEGRDHRLKYRKGRETEAAGR